MFSSGNQSTGLVVGLLGCNSLAFICSKRSSYPIRTDYILMYVIPMCVGVPYFTLQGFSLEQIFLRMRGLIPSSFVISQSIPHCIPQYFHIPFIPFFEVLRMSTTSCGIASTYRWLTMIIWSKLKAKLSSSCSSLRSDKSKSTVGTTPGKSIWFCLD